MEGSDRKPCFVEQGDVFVPSSTGALKVIPTMPPVVLGIEQVPMSERLQLRRLPPLAIPETVYGDVEERSARILNTFNIRASDSTKPNQSTGVLCVGEKGSGKSLLSKVVALKALAQGCPVIVISSKWNPQALAELLASVRQKVVIVLDELDKLYPNPEEQESLLSILDGIYNGSRLWLLSANMKYRISNFMINRPSRIFYLFEYKGLSSDVIENYCSAKKLSPQVAQEVAAVAALFTDFNFDMLQGLVEEVERYGERPGEALKWLNISQQSFGQDARVQWNLTATCGDVTIFRTTGLRRSPVELLSDGVFVPALMAEGRLLPYSDNDDEDEEKPANAVEVGIEVPPTGLDFSGMRKDPKEVRGTLTAYGHTIKVALKEVRNSSSWFSQSHLDLLT